MAGRLFSIDKERRIISRKLVLGVWIFGAGKIWKCLSGCGSFFHAVSLGQARYGTMNFPINFHVMARVRDVVIRHQLQRPSR